jgi:hypothetical protein
LGRAAAGRGHQGQAQNPEVSWQAPGNKFDWISIYKADDPDLYG